MGPPSLLHLTTQIVASNIEKYPAGLWGVLSESQWDAVLRARVYQKTLQLHRLPNSTAAAAAAEAIKNQQPPHQKSTTLLLPSLSAKHLSLIEQHPQNTHLANSSTADELLWKNILNYKFRERGMNRPPSLSVPCNCVEKTLRECASVLLEICCTEDCDRVGMLLGFEEFVAECTAREKEMKCREELLLADTADNGNGLLKDSESDSDNDEQQQQEIEQQIEEQETANSDNNNTDDELLLLQHRQQYQQHIQQLANRNFETLKRTCYTLSESPMDVQLLAETKIGKSVSKAVKTLTKKLMKQRKSEDERTTTTKKGGVCDSEEEEEENAIELREMLWKRVVRWNGPIICYTSTTQQHHGGGGDEDGQRQQQQRDKRRQAVELTPLELLQKLLEDWKEMASDSGVEIRSDSATVAATASPKKKKRRMDTSDQKKHDNRKKPNDKFSNIRVTNCGRDKHISLHQHIIDMNYLHNSPDWRSLYAALTNRELELRKSHGERVRATREHLERDRPKIGKVVLKRAVRRVKGGDVGLCGGMSTNKATTTLATIAGERKMARQEAILSKSKGMRAIQKHRSLIGSGSTATTSTKVSQIRQTSKVAAKWAKSSFGNSVASAAGSKSGVRKVGTMRKEQAQVQLSLQNGKTMKLPSVSNAAVGKSTGKFSSLQQKMTAKSRGGGGKKKRK